MNTRTTTSTVTFGYPFALAGYPDELPAGDYEIVVDEDLLQGLNVAAYRRTATHLVFKGRKGAGRTEMRPIFPEDLEQALSLDQQRLRNDKNSEAALSPLEDTS